MYTHCCNHILNLVIITSSQLPVIRNAMATISDICVFLSRSAQRVSIFQENVEREVSSSVSLREKLKPIWATRWVERHDSIIIFVTLLPAVVSTLEELQQENKQVEVATKAVTLLNFVQKCTFLIAALVMQHTSGIILPFSKLLQKKELVIDWERIGDYLQWLSSLTMCWIFSDKTEAIAKTFFIKYLTKLRMNVKNIMLHCWFPEDTKVNFSEIIILLITLSIFFGKPYLYRI